MLKAFFTGHFRTLGTVSFFRGLVGVPVGIVSARLLASAASFAAAGNVGGVAAVAAWLLALTVGMKIFSLFTGVLYEKALANTRHQARMDLFRLFLSSPLTMLSKSGHGDTTEKLSDDFNTLSDLQLSVFPKLLSTLITATAYLLFLAAGTPLLAAGFFVISLVQLLPPVIEEKYIVKNYANSRVIEGTITNFVIEGFRGFSTIRLYGLKSWYIEKMKGLHEKFRRLGNITEIASAAATVMDNFMENITRYGSAGLAGLFVLLKFCSLEEGIQAVALSGGIFGAVMTAFNLIPRFAVARVARQRLSTLFDENGVPAEGQIQNAKIRVKNLSFQYIEKEMGKEKAIFSNANMIFDGDKVCVIKGQNGAGKSTLLGLAAGILRPLSGTVETGGEAPEQLHDDNWTSRIFYLPQEDPLFDFSPAELFTSVNAGKAETARRCCRDFGLPEELITVRKINELSGGERKKVFLALAFACEPRILLLDEPSNSLDKDGKETLRTMLREKRGGAILITHDNVFDAVAEQVFVVKDNAVFQEV